MDEQCCIYCVLKYSQLCLQSCANYLRKTFKIFNITPSPKLQSCREAKSIQIEAKNMCNWLVLLPHGFGSKRKIKMVAKMETNMVARFSQVLYSAKNCNWGWEIVERLERNLNLHFFMKITCKSRILKIFSTGLFENLKKN